MQFNGIISDDTRSVNSLGGCGSCKTVTSFSSLNSAEPMIGILKCDRHGGE